MGEYHSTPSQSKACRRSPMIKGGITCGGKNVRERTGGPAAADSVNCQRDGKGGRHTRYRATRARTGIRYQLPALEDSQARTRYLVPVPGTNSPRQSSPAVPVSYPVSDTAVVRYPVQRVSRRHDCGARVPYTDSGYPIRMGIPYGWGTPSRLRYRTDGVPVKVPGTEYSTGTRYFIAYRVQTICYPY